MSYLLQPSDFKGKYKIGQNGYLAEDLQDFIDIYEKEYLQNLLGCDLYNLFIDDLDDGDPTSPIYQVIFKPICIDVNCGIIESAGMLDMLKAFIYFEYGRDSDASITISGNTESTSDNSIKPSQIKAGLYKFYNRGVKSYKNIQFYICENIDDYPEYNGQEIEYDSWV